MVSRISGQQPVRRPTVDGSAMLKVHQQGSQKAEAGRTTGWTPGASKKDLDFTRFNPSFEVSRANRNQGSPLTEVTMTSGRTTVHWDQAHGFTTGANNRPLSHAELLGLEKLLGTRIQQGHGGVMHPEPAVLAKVRDAIAAEH